MGHRHVSTTGGTGKTLEGFAALETSVEAFPNDLTVMALFHFFFCTAPSMCAPM